MSTPKRSRVSKRRYSLLSQPGQLPKQFMAWLLRLIFISARFTRANQAGFVLPTTILLLLVVSLTVGSLSFRAFSRSASVIAEREQLVVYGAAAPAIERAKAKLEYLFDKKVPSNSTPSSSELEAFLRDGESQTAPFTISDAAIPNPETRVDLNNDGTLDNAWWFAADINGDGTIEPDEKIVYSILVHHEASPPGSSTVKKISEKVDANKANALVTRNGPIDVSSAGGTCPVSLGTNEEGWQEQTTGSPIIKKVFQIDAFAMNTSDTNRTVSAIEVQQVREGRKGSKWGAWFRNDLEAFPGEDFTWNGAIHTEGSLFLGPKADFNLRMISSNNSCLYTQTASEIELVELGQDTPGNTSDDYVGQVVAGNIGGPKDSLGFNGTATKDTTVDIYDADGDPPPDYDLNKGTDSIKNVPADDKITNIALDPIAIFTQDKSTYRSEDNWDPDDDFWTKADVQQRFEQTQNAEPPFVDDTYRADGRFGPKASYDKSKNLDLSTAEAKLGDKISTSSTSSNPAWSATQISELDDSVTGLDGYWEKQATNSGAKVIVGERLQLGNPFGWKGNYASDLNPDGSWERKSDGSLKDTSVKDVKFKRKNSDSLYPPYDNNSSLSGDTINGKDDQSLRLHRRSLNDNLAAVQAMAVYHYKNSDGKEYPLACMSLVSHPGTKKTVDHARTFNKLPRYNAGALSLTTGTPLVNVDFDGAAGNDVDIDADFFFGYGTNSWEYEPPLGTESSFATAYNDDTKPLKKALKNLAFFAGDPRGGAPSFEPVQGQIGSATDPFVHPYPHLAMWGDYSQLRRILDSGSTYTNLSIADKTTVQTAACTLGMLATNIQVANSLNYATNSDVQNALRALADSVGGLEVTPANPAASTDIDYRPEAYISALERAVDIPGLGLARLFHLKEQIARDRTYGFAKTPTSPTFFYPSSGGLTSDRQISQDQTLTSGTQVELDFDPVANNFFGLGSSGSIAPGSADELRFLQLAAISRGLKPLVVTLPSPSPDMPEVGLPKFPALYYLFPTANHDYKGTGLTPLQPDNEPYIDGLDNDGDPATNNYLNDSNDVSGSLYEYQALSSSDLDTILAKPRKAIGDWTTPHTTTTGAADFAARPNKIQRHDSSGTLSDLAAVLFQDKAFMDGREMLSVRTVEIDVAMATDTTNTDVDEQQVNGQSWFTEGESNIQGGIFYAFREDARREDEIVRPIKGSNAVTQWTNCGSITGILTADCRMNFNADAEQDPPVRRSATAADNNYISPKPVDFYPDPERRPYGFRLSNGKKLHRADNVSTGLTFITDNALYVKGDFNHHNARKAATPVPPTGAVTGGDSVEEFFTPVTGTTPDDITYDEFYEDRGAVDTDFDQQLFAKSDGDDWRVVELVADAVNILSSNFNDGVITDYFLEEKPTAKGGAVSSYQNTFRVKNPGLRAWGGGGGRFRYPGGDDTVRPALGRVFPTEYAATTTNAAADANPIWPFWIRRNGDVSGADESAIFVPNPNDAFDSRQKDQIRASATRVNALLISGIIPSQYNQSYGGLHNFPRLNEFWLEPDDKTGIELAIAGAFYQLNFSTASTGLFEHDINGAPKGAWQPGTGPTDGDSTYYYGSPKRTWGYDVGFQYTSPGPVSQRFSGNETIRSEYYKELAADDPYIRNLLCAEDSAGAKVITIPNVTNSCP